MLERTVLSKPADGGDGDGGVVGGASDADAVVGFGDAAFGGGDVGAALEEFRRQAYGDGGRLGLERGGGQGEGGGRLADEDGDGVLELGADDGDVAGLDARGFELGLGLIDVGLAGDAAFEAVGGDAEGLFVVLDGVVEEFLLGVGGAGFEVVHGELGLEAEHGGLHVRGAGLSFFAGSADVAADAAPEIDLVAELDGEDDVAGAVVVGGLG